MGSRRHVIVGALVFGMLVAGLAALAVVDPPRAVSVDQAVGRFRDAPVPPTTPASDDQQTSTSTIPTTTTTRRPTTTAPSPPDSAAPATSVPPDPIVPFSSLPEPGVYSYATTGGERLDFLLGEDHRYPPITTITVHREGCGFRENWVALEQRYDERLRCPANGASVLGGYTLFHQFFGQSDRRVFTCSAGTDFAPALLDPGTTFSGHCSAPGIDSARSGTVVGEETLVIGGDQVPTMHLRVRGTITGDSTGFQTADWWVRLSDGLVVAHDTVVETQNQSILGSVGYHERLTLRLTSVVPLT